MRQHQKQISTLGILLATIPILWLSSMLVHDFAPTGLLRDVMSSLLDKINWLHIVFSGVAGAFFTAIAYAYSRKPLYIVMGVVSYSISVFVYGLMTGNMGGM